jgi:ATP dependent DNA ligase domain
MTGVAPPGLDSGNAASIFAPMSISNELRRRLRAEQSRPRFEPFRILARRDQGGVRLLTRNGNDFTEHFPHIAEAIRALNVRSCVIDGEAIVTDDRGLAVFELIRGHDSLLFSFPALCVGVPNAVGEQAIEMAVLWVHPDAPGARKARHLLSEWVYHPDKPYRRTAIFPPAPIPRPLISFFIPGRKTQILNNGAIGLWVYLECRRYWYFSNLLFNGINNGPQNLFKHF